MSRARRRTAASSAPEGPFLPLTERVLRFLPVPRWIGIVLWGFLPVPELFGVVTILQVADAPVRTSDLESTLLEIAIYVNATLLCVWGSGRLARDLDRIRPVIARLTSAPGIAADRPIRGVSSWRGPLALTFAFTAMDFLLTSLEYGWGTALLAAPIGFVFQLPLLTFFWTYLSILIGLNRLGGMRLALDEAPGDRTLGLRPIGDLAFTGFWIFSVALAPILVITATSIVQLVLNLVFFLLGVGVFLLSLARLHGKLVEAKRGHMSLSRELYSAAYQPILLRRSLTSLRSQMLLLSSAEALERRAGSIQEWPFDDVLSGRIAIIVTSVVATVIARIVLETLGL